MLMDSDRRPITKPAAATAIPPTITTITAAPPWPQCRRPTAVFTCRSSEVPPIDGSARRPRPCGLGPGRSSGVPHVRPRSPLVHLEATGRPPLLPRLRPERTMEEEPMVKHRRLGGALVALLALTLVAAACGSDDDGGGSGDTGGTDAVSGSITISGSSTVEPISSVVAEEFNADNPDVADQRRRSRYRRRLRTLLQGRDRHRRRFASDRGRGGEGLPEGRHRVHGTRGRPGRRHGDDEPRERRRDVPELRRPLRAVRAGVRRHRHLERRRLARAAGRWHRWVPGCPAGDHRARRGVGDLRRLHRPRGHRRHRDRAGRARGRGRRARAATTSLRRTTT